MSLQALRAARWLGLGNEHADFLRRHVIEPAERAITMDRPLHEILIAAYMRGLSHAQQIAEEP